MRCTSTSAEATSREPWRSPRGSLSTAAEFGDANLVAMGLSGQGRLLLYAGLVPEALALLDEAMIGVTTSEVSPVIAGHVYCAVIEGCQEIRDYARVAQWTKALTQWCQSQPDLVPFTGQCAVHRAQVMRAHGDFPAALEELDRAYQRYTAAGQTPAVGLALSERGDILRIQGAFAVRRDRLHRGQYLRSRPAARARPAVAGDGSAGGGRRRRPAAAAGDDESGRPVAGAPGRRRGAGGRRRPRLGEIGRRGDDGDCRELRLRGVARGGGVQRRNRAGRRR